LTELRHYSFNESSLSLLIARLATRFVMSALAFTTRRLCEC